MCSTAGDSTTDPDNVEFCSSNHGCLPLQLLRSVVLMGKAVRYVDDAESSSIHQDNGECKASSVMYWKLIVIVTISIRQRLLKTLLPDEESAI